MTDQSGTPDWAMLHNLRHIVERITFLANSGWCPKSVLLGK